MRISDWSSDVCSSDLSGRVDHEQGISKAGNRRARQIAIELAWLWLRHQPHSALSRWLQARVGDQRGRVRRIAIVADRKSVGEGTRVSVRVDLGGRRLSKKNKYRKATSNTTL